MNDRDLKIAGKIAALVSRFSAEWLEYQDWLRDIVFSSSILQQRHPDWLAGMILRWRLLYFVVYVGAIITIDRLLKKLASLGGIGSKAIAAIAKFFDGDRYIYIFQRTATLIAVAELTLCAIAGLTGILLAFYYQPGALKAHESLTNIVNQVNYGSLILSLHNLAGNSLIGLTLIQIVIMFLGRQFLLPWLAAWISGICFTLTTIGLSWTAIVLNWEQTSFWRLKIELSIVASIPLVGANLQKILLGGNGINSVTLQHMYALHSYVLAIIAVFISVTHLVALIYQEQNWKPKSKQFALMQLYNKPVDENSSVSID